MTTSQPKTVTETPEERARAFLIQADHFKLGHLPTESRHPRTTRLSQLATDKLPEAIALLKDVELTAVVDSVLPKLTRIDELHEEVHATLAEGGKIFLCGCGATGRLSLVLETLWREETSARASGRSPQGGADGQTITLKRADYEDRVRSFIAGGDYALVRSIENFEDFPEYGARQLHDLGFQSGDLMIGTSEGGETPFVIGAVEEAAKTARRKPYFIFCNPPEMLAKTVERSRRIIENPGVRSFSLETGPMAVSGSTRMQATTALMLAVGAAMFSSLEPAGRPRTFIDDFIANLKAADLTGLAPLIEREAEIYADGAYCLHRTDRYGITVLTDTTERSPTFSLLPFENALDPKAPVSWTYLVHAHANGTDDSWRKLLGRESRPLTWPGFAERFGRESLKGFDFSPDSIVRRAQLVGADRLKVMDIVDGGTHIDLRLEDREARLKKTASLLGDHLLLKSALNISSTLTMGRLNRFSGNLMLYVRAANNKLVDRAIRYIRILLDDEGIKSYSYEDVCLALFRTVEGLPHNEPAVWRTFEKLRDEAGPARS